MKATHTTYCSACKQDSSFEVDVAYSGHEIPRKCPCGHITRFIYYIIGAPEDRNIAVVPQQAPNR